MILRVFLFSILTLQLCLGQNIEDVPPMSVDDIISAHNLKISERGIRDTIDQRSHMVFGKRALKKLKNAGVSQSIIRKVKASEKEGLFNYLNYFFPKNKTELKTLKEERKKQKERIKKLSEELKKIGKSKSKIQDQFQRLKADFEEFRNSNRGILVQFQRLKADFEELRNSNREILVQFRTQLNSYEKIPVGTILSFYGKKEQIPQDFLLCDGGQISAKEDEKYQAIFNHLKTTNPSLLVRDDEVDKIIKLPDLRGTFLRGLDLGRGIDPMDRKTNGPRSRSLAPDEPVGSYQEESHMLHNHMISSNAWSGKQGGPEVRPENIAVNFIIKY